MFSRSPFPGMDPWLEQFWPDVRHKVINDVADQLSAGLPPDLYVVVERDLYVADPEATGEHVTIRPDAFVLDKGGSTSMLTSRGEEGGVAIADPIRIVLPTSPVSIAHLEIRDVREHNPLVTAIEVFSPTNKRDPRARAEYLRKRQAYYHADATVVELDLLRAGQPLIDVPLEYINPTDRQAYACGVRRGGQAGDIELEYYPISLRQRLPRLRVPLRPGDPDVVIDLQPPIAHAYARGRYGTRLDYTIPPEPPLSASDAAWAAERVAAAAAPGA